MFLFSVVEAVLHGMTEEMSRLLEPCLRCISEKYNLLDCDYNKVLTEVMEYFSSQDMLKIFEITNLVREKLESLKKLPVRFKME